jgi:hypothetical protein
MNELPEEHDSYDVETVGYFLRWHNKSKRLAWVKPVPMEVLEKDDLP